MDRRRWLQLITILTAAREAPSQQGGGQNPPMRVTKEQVVGALALMGLEFQDAELDMMMRGVNQALAGPGGWRTMLGVAAVPGALLALADSYTGRQYQPQYRRIDVWAHA